MKKTTRLRARLKQGGTLFVPGCYNALSARILDKVGFDAIYMTGYGTSLALLGMPDCGLTTMTEMHMNARYIANAADAPVIADADTGYGNAINVIRTVREYVQTGVAGIHIEDQVSPKRCGHVGTLDEAISRANAYLAAGADMAFVEGPVDVGEVKRICDEVKGPILYNQTGVSPRFTQAEMEELGIAVAIAPGALLRSTIQHVYDLAVDLRDNGPDAERRFIEQFQQHPVVGDFHGFAGFDQVMIPSATSRRRATRRDPWVIFRWIRRSGFGRMAQIEYEKRIR